MGNALSDCNNNLMFTIAKEENEVSDGYFNLIHKIQENNYMSNANNSHNVVMSLDKKGFTTTITSTRRVINLQEDIKIDWLQFLYYFLYKQIEKQRIWAQPVFDAIEKEIFLHENDFKSEFFYKEFEITTRPTPITKAMEKMLLEDIVHQKYEKKQKNLSVTKHFGGSFYSSNVVQEEIPEDPASEYKFLRLQIKQYISALNKQVKDSDHPINIVTVIFCDHFADYVESTIANLKRVSMEMTKEDYQDKLFTDTKEVTLGLQKIIIKLQIILKLYYATTLNYSCFSEEKDEVINIITTLVFNQNCIYNSMFALYQLSEGNQLKCLEQKFFQYQNIQPDELNINVKFRLDLSTLEYQKELLSKKKVNKLKEDGIPKDSLEVNGMIKAIEDKMLLSSLNNSFSLKLNYKDEEIPIQSSRVNNRLINIDAKNDRNSNKPLIDNSDKLKKFEKNKVNLAQKGYRSALKLLQSIKSVQTPFEKILIISKISDKITSSINTFWKDLMAVISPEFLSIEADTLMEIFIFLLIKSQMTELPIHLQMIKYFTTNTTKTSMIGYYYTTLDAAINYIQTSESILKNDLFN